MEQIRNRFSLIHSFIHTPEANLLRKNSTCVCLTKKLKTYQDSFPLYKTVFKKCIPHPDSLNHATLTAPAAYKQRPSNVI